MINSKGTKNIGRYKQRGLWEIVVPDPGPALKVAMNEAIRCCSLSRDDIVDHMNMLALTAGITCNGRSQKVTTALLDKWVAASAKTYFIPLRLLPIFCRVVGSSLPLQAFAAYFQDVEIISQDDHKKLRWAEAEINARTNRKTARRLAHEVGL